MRVKMNKNVLGVKILAGCKKLVIGDKFTAEVNDLKFGKNVTIGNNVTIKGNYIDIKDDCIINDDVTIDVREKFVLGARSVIGKHSIIAGMDIEIGDELWSDTWVTIGGGSCYEIQSKLRMGCWCHLGTHSFINTARPVIIGNEVGLGMATKILTHGAYQSILDGFPVKFKEVEIGDNCWLPNATVLPGVKIGKNTVVAANSVVTANLPAGCLAGGVPARVIKSHVYPRQLTREEIDSIMKDFFKVFSEMLNDEYKGIRISRGKPLKIATGDTEIIYDYETPPTTEKGRRQIVLTYSSFKPSTPETTVINLANKTITGKADLLSERLRDQLRRYGIRFKTFPQKGRYAKWS